MNRSTPVRMVLVLAALAAVAIASTVPNRALAVDGFLQWRGGNQNGTLDHGSAPDHASLTGTDANLLWSIDLPGRGSPVIGRYDDGDRLFVLGYTGEGADLLETIVCLDPVTGEEYWRRGYSDFISDIIYNRYSIGAPTIDPDTGNVYILTSPGLLIALDKDGNELWQVSMLEAYGRLTFPNGRTGAVAIDGDLAIVNAITSNWGREGQARNRFYAFDKGTGELVWSSDPGVGPPFLKDSSFSTPFIETRDGVRLFYAGTGDGNLVAVNARDGKPLWRYQMSKGGVNCSPVIWPGPDGELGNGDDLILETHGQENISDTGQGYMIAINAGDALAAAKSTEQSPAVITDVVWRNDDVSMFTSSPTLVGDTVYQCTTAGYLVAIDAATGETRWKEKIGGDQLHASPLYVGGKLYVPFWNEGLFIIEPGDTEPASIQHTELAGQSIGSPSVYNGMLYVHTTEKLYCFGAPTDSTAEDSSPGEDAVSDEVGAAQALLVVPSEFLIGPGQTQGFLVHAIDANGLVVESDIQPSEMAKWIPPTARVQSELAGEVTDGRFVASDQGQPSAGALRFASGEGQVGTARGRVLKSPPYANDFEEFTLGETDPGDQVTFSHPPLPWIGARLKWQVRQDPTDDSNQVLAKTLDRVLFQRSMVFTGHPDDSNYTVSASVMTDGNRRGMSVVGVINQRYIIALDGNKRAIEVSSNHDRVKMESPFMVVPGKWFRLTTRVDVNEDGSGVVRAKAWAVDETEPDGWTIEAEVPNVHKHGSPGLYGFSPQSRFRVYIDDLEVTPNN